MSAIQPKILVWARETAGLTLEDAAHALGLNNAHGKTGPERLQAMEAGADEPSRAVITKMAKEYRRPLLVFYLAEPPRQGYRGQDFRTLPGKKQFNPELDALIRDISAREGIIRSMLEDDEAKPLDFIGSASMALPVNVMVERVTERIGFSLARFRRTTNAVEAFAYLRERIEASGVYVLLLGNLGSYHTNMPVEVFRGFALADTIAPMIVINDNDARTAWSFTGLHELVHLFLGQTGISGDSGENAVEQYCNNVAGEVLLPASELQQHLAPTKNQSVSAIAAGITSFAAERRVSSLMVAYKLYRIGQLPRATWAIIDKTFRHEYESYKLKEAVANRKHEGGPNYYVVRRHRVGQALLGLVRRSLDEGIITYPKAGRVLGVRPVNVAPLLSMRGAR
jgi:Zn-dependent peptidase ImmA (M78 family)